jgi:hypothetical protein
VYEQPLVEWKDTWHAIQNSQMPSMLGSVAMIAITNKKMHSHAAEYATPARTGH